MNRRATMAVVTLAAVGAAGTVPALAAKPKPKPISGTFSYTDVTPDPTVTANSDASTHCHGNLPASPSDVNSHALTVKGKGIPAAENNPDWHHKSDLKPAELQIVRSALAG